MAVCTSDSTLAVTDDGSLYSLSHGLHQAEYGIDTLVPRILPLDDDPDYLRVVMVSAVKYHGAAVMEDGSVYTWGRGQYGQLGNGEVLEDEEEEPLRPIWLDKEMWGGSPAVQVSCGYGYTIVLTADGRVLTCGFGWRGQLGHGDRTDKHVLTQVGMEHFKGVRIVMVAAGMEHSAAVGEDGSLWTWGGGDWGGLGHNDEEDRLVPTQLTDKVMRGNRMVMVAMGTYYTAAVAHDGMLWMWGYGDQGKLGLGDRDKRLVPTMVPVEAFGGSRVLMASCGDEHTLAVTEDGNVYSCGYGQDGQLGHNDNDDKFAFTLIEPKHFGFAKIVLASAGSRHSSAVTDDGALYTWGMGLGLRHGYGENKYVPTRVDMELLDNKRVGRYQGLRPEHAVAFAMGLEDRLGIDCVYNSMPSEILRQIIEKFMLHPEGPIQELEGVVRLMGGGLKTDWRRK